MMELSISLFLFFWKYSYDLHIHIAYLDLNVDLVVNVISFYCVEAQINWMFSFYLIFSDELFRHCMNKGLEWGLLMLW